MSIVRACVLVVFLSAPVSVFALPDLPILSRFIYLDSAPQSATTSTTTTATSTATTTKKEKAPSPQNEYLRSLTERIASTLQSFFTRSLTEELTPSVGGTPVRTLAPQTQGIPFGGPITTIRFCKNGKIWVMLGAPTPGPFIWSPGTVSYQYGPPSFVGQYLLGMASGPDVCVISSTVSLPGLGISFHGSSGAPSTPPPSPSTGTGEAQCTNGSDVKFKRGVGQELKPDIAENLGQFCDAAGDLDWQVTEGCPPTRTHVNACHANCTCVDIGFESRQYTVDKVQRALAAGNSVGARLVFESSDKALIDSLIASGVPSDQAKYYPSCSTGSRPCVTGNHFSYYCLSCN